MAAEYEEKAKDIVIAMIEKHPSMNWDNNPKETYPNWVCETYDKVYKTISTASDRLREE